MWFKVRRSLKEQLLNDLSPCFSPVLIFHNLQSPIIFEIPRMINKILGLNSAGIIKATLLLQSRSFTSSLLCKALSGNLHAKKHHLLLIPLFKAISTYIFVYIRLGTINPRYHPLSKQHPRKSSHPCPLVLNR